MEAENTNVAIHARDIEISDIIPSPAPTTDVYGARVLCRFTAHIKPLDLTISGLVLAHHDGGEFVAGPGKGAIIPAWLNMTRGTRAGTAIAAAASKAWNALSAEDIRDLRLANRKAA
ncbi:hypothetical protein QD336_00045 [Rhizobium sp. BR 250]